MRRRSLETYSGLLAIDRNSESSANATLFAISVVAIVMVVDSLSLAN